MIPLILGAASLAGGIMQAAGGRKVIDPEWLKQHFGADAVNQETIDMFNNIINSPYGTQVMADAASQGSQFETALRSNTAQSGAGTGEDAKSGASIFSESAAGGTQKGLVGRARAGIYQNALSTASQLVSQRLNAYMNQPALKQPTAMQSFGADLGAAAEKGLGRMSFGNTTADATSRTQNEGEGSIGIETPNAMVKPALMASAMNTNAVQPSRFRASLGGYG